ncbi:MAG: hypothetical protein J5786_06745 [Clostridiales bacterium]|nr:hypothetical protein [Clostridiales bacterium]
MKSTSDRLLSFYCLLFMLDGALSIAFRYYSPGMGLFLPDLSVIMYCTMIVYWGYSVRMRLLDTPVRRYILTSTYVMVISLTLRAFKYRMLSYHFILRYIWYGYYVYFLLLPFFFLMICVYITRPELISKARLLLIPNLLLIAGVLSNDLHQAAFRFGSFDFYNNNDDLYSRGPLYYVIFSWIALMILAGLILIRQKYRDNLSANTKFRFVAVVAACAVLLALKEYLSTIGMPFPWAHAEMFFLGMIALTETLIANGMIPHNDNYSVYMSALSVPVEITDMSYYMYSKTGSFPEVNPDHLKRSLTKALFLDRDTRLSGNGIKGGYVFWTEDLSTINSLNMSLEEANQAIAEENDLIEAETELKKNKALVESRNHIYNEISLSMYPHQIKVKDILDKTRANSESFRENVTDVAVLNAYIKRRTNLLLLASEGNFVSAHELLLCFQESVRYLNLKNISAGVDSSLEGDINVYDALNAFDRFEIFIELVKDHISSLLITLNSYSIRFILEGDGELGGLIDSVSSNLSSVKFEDNAYYINLKFGFEEVWYDR